MKGPSIISLTKKMWQQWSQDCADTNSSRLLLLLLLLPPGFCHSFFLPVADFCHHQCRLNMGFSFFFFVAWVLHLPIFIIVSLFSAILILLLFQFFQKKKPIFSSSSSSFCKRKKPILCSPRLPVFAKKKKPPF